MWGCYTVTDVERVPPESALWPNFRMVSAALVSLSNSVPPLQEYQRSDRLFLTSAPHPEHICDVLNGFTKTTTRPARAALALTISVNVAHPTSSRVSFNDFREQFDDFLLLDMACAADIGTKRLLKRVDEVYGDRRSGGATVSVTPC